MRDQRGTRDGRDRASVEAPAPAPPEPCHGCRHRAGGLHPRHGCRLLVPVTRRIESWWPPQVRQRPVVAPCPSFGAHEDRPDGNGASAQSWFVYFDAEGCVLGVLPVAADEVYPWGWIIPRAPVPPAGTPAKFDRGGRRLGSSSAVLRWRDDTGRTRATVARYQTGHIVGYDDERQPWLRWEAECP